ncbi:MAG: hypothetical protein HY209_06135, partial [Candidatus Omnitrophica bacterium]|nr:hypothetical protein [Candidatus Omnitrophota bacterium]
MFAALFFWSAQAQATVQINQVLRGSYTFTGGSSGVGGEASTVVAIGATVNTAKSIILLSTSASYNAPGESLFSAYFDDSSHIIIQRGLASENNTGTPTVNWQVVEFANGVTVTAGSTSLGTTITSKVVTLPSSLTDGKAMVILNGGTLTGMFENYYYSLGNQSGRTLAAGNDEVWTPTADITTYGDANNAAQITIQRNDKDSDSSSKSVNVGLTVYYQVISFDADVSIQHGTSSITNTASSVTATVTSVDTTKSMLFFTYRAPANASGAGLGVESDYALSGAITNSTTLTFTRATTGSTGSSAPLNIAWFLLTFTDATSILSGSLSSGTNASISTGTLTLDTVHNFSLISASGASGDSATGFGDILWRQTFSSTVLTANRDGGGTTATTIPYFIAQPPLVKVVTPAGSETWKVHDTQNITWTAAASVANVKIEYSGNNGGAWNTIIASTASSAGSNNYSWTVGYNSDGSSIFPSSEVATQCLVRITDTASSSNTMTSPAFTIKSQLSITAPVGGELWLVTDTTRAITWNSYGNFNSTVKLQYSIDAAHTTWTNISGATTITTATNGSNSYTWSSIPIAATGATDKIQVVSNAATPTVSSASPSNFEIRGSITVTAPAANAVWSTGYANTITWTLGSTTTNVDLSYSVDNGVTYTSIATNQNAQNIDSTHGSYSWTPALSLTPSTTSYIKVVDHSSSNVSAISGKFTIQASITVNSPVGGEVWKVDDTNAITWTLGGGTSITYVTIKYCTDFNTSQTWQTVTGAGQVDATLGTFNWTVPDAIGAATGVRIYKYLDATIYGTSPAAFSIKGNISIINPAAGIYMPANSNYVITWTPHGGLHTAYGDNFKLEYSKNGGTSFSTIYTGLNGSSGSTTWNSADIPIDNLQASNTQIKIGLSGDDSAPNGVYGQSSSFYIIGNLSLTYPTGGQTFNIGNACVITWTAYPSGNNQLGAVRIAYSINSGTDGYPDTQVIATGIDASTGPTGYSWTIPNTDLLYSTDRIQVKLASDASGQVKTASTTDFNIKGSLTLTRPSTNSGDTALTWLCGTQENITWTRQGSSMGAVDIFYSKDNGNDLYVNVIDNSGTIASSAQTYAWTIPSDATVFKTGDNGENTQVKIKLVLHSDSSGVNSKSAQPLTIKSQFTNLVPNGGTITVGSPFNITWTTKGDVATVNVNYSTNSGADGYPNAIATNVSNAGGWNWNPVNCPVSGTIRVKVVSTAHSDINTPSAGDVNAKGSLQITAPTSANTGTSALIPGHTFRITWVTNGGVGSNVGLVDLYYAQDGTTFGSSFAQVDTSVQNYYDWTVPSPASLPITTAKLKVTEHDDSSVTSTSPDPFDIRGNLWDGTTNHALVEPNGGEIYYVGGSNINMQWKFQGVVGNCDLYYDTSAGSGGYPNHIATVAYNNNVSNGIASYSWTVPGSAGTQYRVKLVSVNDPTYAYANSQGNFVVKGNVVLTAPGMNAGSPEVWYVDSTNPVSWNMTGGISQVDLLLDTHGGSDSYTDYVIASGIGGSASPYQWSIAQETDRQTITSNTCRVRVRDHNDTTVYSSSTNNFSMKPRVTIGALQNTPWAVQDQPTITWTNSGTISQLNLYYSSAGQSGPWGSAQITGISAAAGSVIWTIPTSAVSWGNAVLKLVRVESGTEDTAVTSQSPNFTIKGKINVTAPLTNQTYNVQQTGTITWNVVGAVGNVDIKYNTNSAGGYPDTDWAAFTGATGIVPDYCTNVPGTPYTFTIPSTTAPSVKIRIFESNHAEVFGPPMAGSPTHNFKGSIIFDKPPGNPSTKNQTITIGPSSYTINWSLVGDFTTLRAYYKKVGDAQWSQIGSDLGGTITQTNYTPIDSDITAADGSNKVLFRVEDALDPSNVYAETGTNEGNTVVGALQILEPVTPVELTVGSTVEVKWKKYGNIGNLKFELWNGSQWLNNAGGSNLPDTYPSGTSGESGIVLVPNWTVPDKIGSGLQIRVTSITYPSLTSTTGQFTIKGGFSSINTPATWYVGQDHVINWQANGSMSSVKIELYNGTTWATIANAYDNGGAGLINGANSYTWSGSDTLQQQRSSTCKIRVTSNQNPDVYIETGNFTLIPQVTVTTPSQAWIAESNSNTISWNTIAAPTTNVDIILSDANNGTGYPVTLASNIAKGSSPYASTVTLPATLTAGATIRVRDHDFPNLIYGDSSTFNVIGQIIMSPTDNTPNASSNWPAGSSQAITWSSKGNLGQVNIKFKHDGGSYSAPLAGSPVAVSDHSYTWSLPTDVISQHVQVKIESVNNPTQEYVESPEFSIRGSFTIDSPGTVNSGDPYTITWSQPANQANLIPNVILQFYDGAAWNYIISSAPHTVSNTGSYSWSVPTNVRATTCKLQVSDPNNSSAVDQTDNFEIRPSINVTAPTSAAQWTIGTQTGNNIVWSTVGPVPTVKIEYSKDNGTTFSYVIESSIDGA